jgi:hypothetical protein
MLTPTDPDPATDLRNKILIFTGTILPDIPAVSLIWGKLSKMLKKSIPDLTLEDYDGNAAKASPWIQIYQFLHGLPFAFFASIAEIALFGNVYLVRGLLAHQLYDWPTHKFKTRDLNPKPFYPLWNWTWKWGIPCPWGFQDYFILSWLTHGLMMLLILASRN